MKNALPSGMIRVNPCSDPCSAAPWAFPVCGGEVIDLAYRDYALADLIDLEKEGADVRPMRTLLQRNRMISSSAAELDQKCCWEVLTDPQLSQRFFNLTSARCSAATSWGPA